MLNDLTFLSPVVLLRILTACCPHRRILSVPFISAPDSTCQLVGYYMYVLRRLRLVHLIFFLTDRVF